MNNSLVKHIEGIGILTDYIEAAMNTAEYEVYEDGTIGGRVRACLGAIGFGSTLEDCKQDVRSALEDWVLIGLRFGDELPIVDGINLNLKREPIPDSEIY